MGLVAGAVLVGGRSTRMGRDKALIEIEGVPMARRVSAAVSGAGCHPVFAVGPAHLTAGLDAVADEHPGEGPLGAILTALRAAAPSPVVVVACDLPWIDVGTVRSLVQAADATHRSGIPADAIMAVVEQREPLCAVWMQAAAPALQRAFDAGERAVHRAAAGLLVVEVPVPAHGLVNVNAPEDLAIE